MGLAVVFDCSPPAAPPRPFLLHSSEASTSQVLISEAHCISTSQYFRAIIVSLQENMQTASRTVSASTTVLMDPAPNCQRNSSLTVADSDSGFDITYPSACVSSFRLNTPLFLKREIWLLQHCAAVQLVCQGPRHDYWTAFLEQQLLSATLVPRPVSRESGATPHCF